MTELRPKLKLVEEKNPYGIPVYVDEDRNYWISIHVPLVIPPADEPPRVFLRVTLFNGDQIELKNAYLWNINNGIVNIIINPDNVRIENEIVGGEGL